MKFGLLAALGAACCYGIASVLQAVAVTAVASIRILGVRMTRIEWVAIVVVCVGLLVLATSTGQEGSTPVGRAFHWALVAAVALPVLLGAAVARTPGATGSLLLGAAAGLGFSIVGVASRVVPNVSLAALGRDPATYALALAGSLGFLLYATALQRGSATTATTPAVVVETTVPAVVGLLLLGDRTRSGGAAPAVCGFLLAVAGSVALARFGEQPPPPNSAGAGPGPPAG